MRVLALVLLLLIAACRTMRTLGPDSPGGTPNQEYFIVASAQRWSRKLDAAHAVLRLHAIESFFVVSRGGGALMVPVAIYEAAMLALGEEPELDDVVQPRAFRNSEYWNPIAESAGVR